MAQSDSLEGFYFAWRLFRDRLSTKANLVDHRIIPPDAHFCFSGCGGVESAHQLFLSCNTFGSLWSLVQSWIGFSSADPHQLSAYFIEFINAAGGLKTRRSFLQFFVFWLCEMNVIIDYSEI
jgi:hypothetical protein